MPVYKKNYLMLYYEWICDYHNVYDTHIGDVNTVYYRTSEMHLARLRSLGSINVHILSQ